MLIIYWGTLAATLAGAISYLIAIRRRPTQSGKLNTSELLLVSAACLVNPLIIGTVLSYGTRSHAPEKARQINHVSMVTFAIWMAGLTWRTWIRF